MRYISTRLVLFFLVTACIAVGTASQTPSTKSAATSTNGNHREPSAIVFKRVGMGEILDKDEGITLGFTSYATEPDGAGAMAMDYEFSNAEKAHAYFEKQLSKTTTIIVERYDKVNQYGKVAGERAQILMRIDKHKNQPAVLWTDEKMFREIYSSSLKDVLELEKLYRN